MSQAKLDRGPPEDSFGAFCRENHVAIEGSPTGSLADLTFAAKDVFDVKGARTGLGQPEWLRTHPPAASTAAAVQALLDEGATLVGKTVSDELCYSLTGENVHYGTPVNPKAPGRIPGGSSSGSASAVAGGLVDFALGSDCGGSVRVPASYCGILGMRPTYGRVSVEGVVPFAPSIDCIGWFARDAGVLERVGRVLLGDDADPSPCARLLVATDAFARADPEVAKALEPAIYLLERIIGPAEQVGLSAEGLETWFEAFRIVQAAEVWQSLGPWIEEARPTFGPGVRERFEAAAAVRPGELQEARRKRAEATRRLDRLLPPGSVVCLPTAPRPAPPIGLSTDFVEVEYRHRAMELLCSAGLAGLPQISLPLGRVGDLPVGFSIMARPGADIDLLALARVVSADDGPWSDLR